MVPRFKLADVVRVTMLPATTYPEIIGEECVVLGLNSPEWSELQWYDLMTANGGFGSMPEYCLEKV